MSMRLSLFLLKIAYFLSLINLPSATALFGGQQGITDLVHHWLHWGANLHSSDKAPPAHHPRAEAGSNPVTLELLPAYITGAGDVNISFKNVVRYSQQMMHRSEIDLVASHLRQDDVYLEYGAGGSTINFAPLVARAYSIEHDCEWASYLSDKLREKRSRYENVHIRCVSVKPGDRGWGTLSPFEHGNYQQFRKYVDAVDALPEKRIDKVFIDGRARLACALKVLPFLKEDSLVFIHDFYARTKHYGTVLEYYTEVARVLARRNNDRAQGPIDEPQGLIVLRRHPNATFPLSVQQIDAIYDKINWREPFAWPLTSTGAYVRYYWGLCTDIGRWGRARNPEDLVGFVGHDLLRIAVLYALVMFVVRNWDTVIRKKERQAETRENRPAERTRSSASGRDQSEIRFMETEGMRAANARRKRASTLPNGL